MSGTHVRDFELMVAHTLVVLSSTERISPDPFHFLSSTILLLGYMESDSFQKHFPFHHPDAGRGTWRPICGFPRGASRRNSFDIGIPGADVE